MQDEVVYTNDGDLVKLQKLFAGDLLHYDYRPDQRKGTTLSDTFRVVQWNIERGQQLDAIIANLKAIKADFVILQELDINCRRSGYKNVPKEIAMALEAELYFVCEFEELDTPERTDPMHAVGRYQKGKQTDPEGTPIPQLSRHFHGNAILSTGVTMSDAAVIAHTFPPINWDEEGVKLGEPRRGFRSALRVCIQPAQRTAPTLPPCYLYCCHLEVFCGALARVHQLADCMADMKRLTRLSTVLSGTTLVKPAFLLGGDLNTMAHGIVRCSRRYGTDRLRLMSIGESEACWVQRKILSRGMSPLLRACCPFSYRFPLRLMSRLHEWCWNNRYMCRLLYGFSFAEQDRYNNSELCLYDPGDKATSITLNNPSYKGMVQGKLDWMLMSNLEARPFRASRGGAAPVDLAELAAMGSVKPTSSSYAYLNALRTDGLDDAAREREDLVGEAAQRHIPGDGYLLFNQDYTASDHRGLVMTVQQNVGQAKEVYPPNGAVYTASWSASVYFAVTRVAVAGLGVYAVSKWLRR